MNATLSAEDRDRDRDRGGGGGLTEEISATRGECKSGWIHSFEVLLCSLSHTHGERAATEICRAKELS